MMQHMRTLINNVRNLSQKGGQLRFQFDVIRLDKTLTLESAHHLKTIVCSKSSLSIVDDLLADYSTRFKRFHAVKHSEALSMLLANLLYAYGHNKGVLYSRNNSGKGERLIMGLIDYLAECGLVESIIQPPNEVGCSSYALALPELKRQLDIAKAKLAKSKNHKPLILRDENKKELSTARLENYTPNKFKQLTKPVDLHNEWWNNNSATISKRPVIPFLHRVFNKSFDLGGRYYGLHQSIPSKDRANILFNGKPTVEIDYSSMHMAILYAWAGVGMIGDPYLIEGYERKAVKAIMLRLVNIENMSSLKAIVTNSAKESRKAAFSEYKAKRDTFERQAASHLKATPPRKPKWLDSHIQNIPEGFNAKAFIQSLHERHSAISQFLGSNDIGLRLQAADSALVGVIMNDLYSQKTPVPVLPVHDSLICRKTNSELVRLTMKHHFREMFGSSIEVTVSENKPTPTPDNDGNHSLVY
jgi:hypothetical protein